MKEEKKHEKTLSRLSIKQENKKKVSCECEKKTRQMQSFEFLFNAEPTESLELLLPNFGTPFPLRLKKKFAQFWKKIARSKSAKMSI